MTATKLSPLPHHSLCCSAMPTMSKQLPHRAMSLHQLQSRAYLRRRQQQTQISSLPATHVSLVSPPPRLTKPKKSVSFAPTASVVSIVKTPSDLTNAWYEKSEYKRFETSRWMSIHAINNVNGDLSQLDPTEHSLTGLEEQLSRKQLLVRKLKSSHYTQLVLEQLNNPSNPSNKDSTNAELQVLSSMLSRHASQRAHWRALVRLTDSP